VRFGWAGEERTVIFCVCVASSRWAGCSLTSNRDLSSPSSRPLYLGRLAAHASVWLLPHPAISRPPHSLRPYLCILLRRRLDPLYSMSYTSRLNLFPRTHTSPMRSFVDLAAYTPGVDQASSPYIRRAGQAPSSRERASLQRQFNSSKFLRAGRQSEISLYAPRGPSSSSGYK
jgi:hypothetical protein